MLSILILSVLTLLPDEQKLSDRLPEIFAKSAAHYKALDAAATPLMHTPEGVRMPHGFRRAERKLDMRDIYWWTSGHFPGSLWYLYEATGDAFLKDRATAWMENLRPVSKYVRNHDTGFIMYCSFGNARRILKTKEYDALLVETAQSLSKRYNEKLGLIRSWGEIADEKDFLVIPDNLMNLELLEFAARSDRENLKNLRFDEIALSHADVTMRHHFRPDGGVRHVLNYDCETGRVKEIRRGQGASCETAWSRGQSWGIYGYTMMYRWTARRAYLDFARKLADYAINHPNMPEDGVPYWDYGAPNEERDTSAASCMASALLELATYLPPCEAARYRGFAVRQLLSLSSDAYFSEGDEIGHWLLKHGVGHKPGHSEIDTPLDYGDYYFLEALLRFQAYVRETRALEPVAAKLPPHAALTRKTFDDRVVFRTRSFDVKSDLSRALTEPIPDTSDDLYLLFWKTGNRSQYEKRFFGRLELLDTLALGALRYPDDARYVARLEEVIAAICNQRSWVLPAHDKRERAHANLDGVLQLVDLFSSELASHLACVVQQLGPRLKPETVARIRAEAERRIFAPLRRETRHHINQGGDIDIRPISRLHWWVDGKNNWNSVCWDCTTCAALGLLDDPRDRAFFVNAAMKSIPKYLSGFTPDGYCSEGIGYWNYGFGHHMRMGTLLRDISNGQLDIFTSPIQRAVATYASTYTLVNGISPAFADGTGQPSPSTLELCAKVWPECKVTPGPVTTFDDAQVWLLRDPEGFSVAFKGGHNDEMHNHNDLGSYYLMWRDKVVSGDPGSEEYTERTFSDRRYESKILNSYGHPVPVVGGKLQGVGAAYRAEVLACDVAGEVGTVSIELKRAYDVPTLQSLVRTIRLDRANKTFTITDRVRFSEPTAFEDVYNTYLEAANSDAESQKAVHVTSADVLAWNVRPEVSVSGATYTLREEDIENPNRIVPHRVGIVLDKPVMEAEVVFAFK